MKLIGLHHHCLWCR